jgi:putative oxidoreductase
MNTLTSNQFQETWAPRALGALRIVSGYLLIFHGTAKLFHVPHIAMFDGVQLFSLMGLAGAIELVGGALLIAGLFTRSTAFIVSGFLAAAYFMGHASKGNPMLPILNGGELAALWSFVSLYFSVAGPGAWALDNLRGGNAGRGSIAPRTVTVP